MQRFLLLICTFLLFSAVSSHAQTVADYSVQLSAQVQKSPAAITLKWKPNANTTSYLVYRKAKTEMKWGIPLATLSGTITSWTDNNIIIGVPYEYYVKRIGSNYTGHGYILTAMEIAPKGNPGTVILVVDDTFALPLAAELKRLENDLKMEGWKVIRHDVKRTGTVTAVKALIKADYLADPANVKTVFLIGHIPVPYSGYFAIDGHNDHQGAWPADVYYGDMDGIWNDSDPFSETSASRKENWNEPGDGKFDEDVIPSAVELEVGRVDMHNLPVFNLAESALMKRYLDKDHAFRNKIVTAKNQALIDDHFGAMGGEAFAASAYKAFAPMFGDSNIFTGEYRTALKEDSYLWSYGAGAGSYEVASGVVRTDSLVKDSLQTVFTMLFGSYFGDWDSRNNLLRAPLASRGLTLTNAWSGRPHWILHHMALGGNIGYATRISQMDSATYFRHPAQVFGAFRQTALMGDPTLKMYYTAPVRNVQHSYPTDSSQVLIQWQAPADNSIAGYYIYRKSPSNQLYAKIDSLPANITSYLDTNPFDGNNIYMIRALRLQKTASGSYYDLSPGVLDSARAVRTSSMAETKKQEINFSVFPNPTGGLINVTTSGISDNESCTIIVTDVLGKVVYQQKYKAGDVQKLGLDLGKNPQGIYLISIQTSNANFTQKIVKSK